MTPFECYFYYFGILLEYRANFRHRNQKISLADTVNKCYIYPDFDDIRNDSCSYPLRLSCASFQDIRTLYNSEKQSLVKLAPRLT